jgi:catechol 2,3-dioxygenase-like lactoylglutathione lyase family enzyme
MRRFQFEGAPTMLSEHPIYVVLLATDLGTAKDFYCRKLGLELIDESLYALRFRCGTTQLTLSKSTTGTCDEQTQASWMVDDLDAELAKLRSRGVEIEHYDRPGLRTVDGIADIGFARIAWLIDPFRNCLGIMQQK